MDFSMGMSRMSVGLSHSLESFLNGYCFSELRKVRERQIHGMVFPFGTWGIFFCLSVVKTHTKTLLLWIVSTTQNAPRPHASCRKCWTHSVRRSSAGLTNFHTITSHYDPRGGCHAASRWEIPVSNYPGNVRSHTACWGSKANFSWPQTARLLPQHLSTLSRSLPVWVTGDCRSQFVGEDCKYCQEMKQHRMGPAHVSGLSMPHSHPQPYWPLLCSSDKLLEGREKGGDFSLLLDPGNPQRETWETRQMAWTLFLSIRSSLNICHIYLHLKFSMPPHISPGHYQSLACSYFNSKGGAYLTFLDPKTFPGNYFCHWSHCIWTRNVNICICLSNVSLQSFSVHFPFLPVTPPQPPCHMPVRCTWSLPALHPQISLRPMPTALQTAPLPVKPASATAPSSDDFPLPASFPAGVLVSLFSFIGLPNASYALSQLKTYRTERNQVHHNTVILFIDFYTTHFHDLFFVGHKKQSSQSGADIPCPRTTLKSGVSNWARSQFWADFWQLVCFAGSMYPS